MIINIDAISISINPSDKRTIPSDCSPKLLARYIAAIEPDIPPTIIGKAPKSTSLMSAKPLRISGPVEIRPLNIATISPVERIKRVSKEVKANNKGVKITPPPTPAAAQAPATQAANPSATANASEEAAAAEAPKEEAPKEEDSKK